MADPYENKAKLGRIVLDAAKAATHDDSNPDLARVNAILTCEVFVSALVDAGCMITRISTARDHREEDEPVQSYRCPRGCDCSCCYGYPDRDCHCFTYPCNCGGGPAEHGAAVGGVTGEGSDA